MLILYFTNELRKLLFMVFLHVLQLSAGKAHTYCTYVRTYVCTHVYTYIHMYIRMYIHRMIDDSSYLQRKTAQLHRHCNGLRTMYVRMYILTYVSCIPPCTSQCVCG